MHFIIEKSQVSSATESCLFLSPRPPLKFSSVYVFMCSPNHLPIQRLTMPMFLVRGASICLVMGKELWNIKADVFTAVYLQVFFQKHVSVFLVTCM